MPWLLLLAVCVMSVSPITILAQTTELNESDSNLNELNVSNSYTVEQVVRNFEFENDGYAVFLKETMKLLGLNRNIIVVR